MVKVTVAWPREFVVIVEKSSEPTVVVKKTDTPARGWLFALRRVAVIVQVPPVLPLIGEGSQAAVRATIIGIASPGGQGGKIIVELSDTAPDVAEIVTVRPLALCGYLRHANASPGCGTTASPVASS
jgi:hypothetical protein